MKNRILVIEDDLAISDLICMNLTVAGYETFAVYRGDEVEAALSGGWNADMALVDVMLPGRDGFALMECFRQRKIPVIYLTARADVASKVKGLKLGAEDYMVKPFEVLELLVRVEKVLERTGKQQNEIQVKDVTISLDSHKVTKQGKEVSLKPLEFDLLVLLAKNQNVAFSREQLLNRIWGSDFLGETRTVDVHIGQIRKKLQWQEEIRTIPKLGYRLEI